MGDALQSVLDGVGKVVHGIDAPLGALAVVVDEADAVNDGVSEVQIAAGQVDLGPQGHLALLHLAVLHHFKQTQILLNGAVPVGEVAGMPMSPRLALNSSGVNSHTYARPF